MHCLRSTGKERAWFNSREEAKAFAANPANPGYHGDIANLCVKCDPYHLSKLSWLEPQFTQADYQMLQAARIQATPLELWCTVCVSLQREGADFFILPSGALRCSKCVEPF